MQKVQSYIKEITNNGKVSPQEEQELNDMAKSLSVNMIFDEKNQESFNKMKLLWKIENEDLPVLSPNVILPKKENCFYSCFLTLKMNPF
jgi:ABC-type Zn uptake system ZnuABC Zn-binding protein ZnuA